jgi:dTDP-4-dehydrorhamnose reductase
MKKIYIAGCGGMLGDAFYKQFKDYTLKCTDKDVNEKWLSFLDFRNFEAYKKDVTDFNPDYLFHLGAYTDLEFCEKNVDDTYETNAFSVEHAVCIANELNIPLLYISSSGVFDGTKKAYNDWDQPNPLTIYGRSKYMGEKFVMENAKRFLTCRAGWMMGGGWKDKKFVRKIRDKILSGDKELFVVNNKYGTPTYTHDFAETVKILIEKEWWGIYNCANEGETNRLEIAKEIKKILGSNVIITEVEDMKEYSSVRPASECLINDKLRLKGIVMRNWKDALKEYLG